MADKHDAGDDDAGWWNCSLCTFKNSSDRFVCEMCDLKRGTSTRKPRCSTDTIVAQVVKQQEQIRQQTKAKPSPKNKTTTGPSNSAAAQATGVAGTAEATSRSKKPGVSRTSTPSVSADSKIFSGAPNAEASQDPTTQRDKPVPTKASIRNSPGTNKRSSNAKPNTSSIMVKQMRAEERTRKREKIRRRENGDSDSDTSDLSSSCSSSSSGSSNTCTDSSDDSTSDDSTDSEHETPETPSKGAKVKTPKREQPVPAGMSLDNSSQYSSSPAMTPEPTTSSPSNHDSKQLSLHPFKIRPVEINGNLIKYSPPTSSGRTGLIIDKKRFTQHSVTVNDVTITFTEFATRQNKYVRKKKKKKSGSRIVAPPASVSPATATVSNKSGND